MHFLSSKIEFPDVSEATPDGLLAIGGDLSPERLLCAYSNGIFPWFDESEPVLWWSPDPRFVIFPHELKVSKSMKQVLRSNKFKITQNQAFEKVINACATVVRKNQKGTWITKSMSYAYVHLHEMGLAKSVEVWQDRELVGGLYGISLYNKIFCGESMFSKVSNASKAGFMTFVQHSNYKLIDCQLHTPHLESLGGRHIPRTEFMNYLKF